MIEQMKQALEALESALSDDKPYIDKSKAAITSLRQAIAEAEKHKCTYPDCPYPCLDLPDCVDAEKQEPVEWGVDWGKAGDVPCVSIIKRKTGGGIEVIAVEYAPYTYPQPKREPLTDEQIWALAGNCLDSVKGRMQFARAIEAAHGIKGEA